MSPFASEKRTRVSEDTRRQWRTRCRSLFRLTARFSRYVQRISAGSRSQVDAELVVRSAGSGFDGDVHHALPLASSVHGSSQQGDSVVDSYLDGVGLIKERPLQLLRDRFLNFFITSRFPFAGHGQMVIDVNNALLHVRGLFCRVFLELGFNKAKQIHVSSPAADDNVSPSDVGISYQSLPHVLGNLLVIDFVMRRIGGKSTALVAENAGGARTESENGRRHQLHVVSRRSIARRERSAAAEFAGGNGIPESVHGLQVWFWKTLSLHRCRAATNRPACLAACCNAADSMMT